MIQLFRKNSQKALSKIFYCVLITPLCSEKEKFLLVHYFPVFYLRSETYIRKFEHPVRVVEMRYRKYTTYRFFYTSICLTGKFPQLSSTICSKLVECSFENLIVLNSNTTAVT